MTNIDRIQLAALRGADVALELLEGAAVAALYAEAKALGWPEPIATVAIQEARKAFHAAHKRLTVPRVTAPGLEGNLPEV